MDNKRPWTLGPWKWFANVKNKNIYLATVDRGRKFVMGFERFGMQGAQPIFQSNKHYMVGVFEENPEICTASDHNGDFEIIHPDATLIAASPEMYEALEDCFVAINTLPENIFGMVETETEHWPLRNELLDKVKKALDKANPERNDE